MAEGFVEETRKRQHEVYDRFVSVEKIDTAESTLVQLRDLVVAALLVDRNPSPPASGNQNPPDSRGDARPSLLGAGRPADRIQEQEGNRNSPTPIQETSAFSLGSEALPRMLPLVHIMMQYLKAVQETNSRVIREGELRFDLRPFAVRGLPPPPLTPSPPPHVPAGLALLVPPPPPPPDDIFWLKIVIWLLVNQNNRLATSLQKATRNLEQYDFARDDSIKYAALCVIVLSIVAGVRPVHWVVQRAQWNRAPIF